MKIASKITNFCIHWCKTQNPARVITLAGLGESRVRWRTFGSQKTLQGFETLAGLVD
jgi:hypothetical protein